MPVEFKTTVANTCLVLEKSWATSIDDDRKLAELLFKDEEGNLLYAFAKNNTGRAIRIDFKAFVDEKSRANDVEANVQNSIDKLKVQVNVANGLKRVDIDWKAYQATFEDTLATSAEMIYNTNCSNFKMFGTIYNNLTIEFDLKLKCI